MLEHDAERLLARDLPDHLVDLAALQDLLGVLLRLQTGLGGQLDDRRGEVLLGDLDLLGLGDRVQQELAAQRHLRALVQLGVELLLGLALAGQVLGQAELGALQLLLDAVPAGVRLVVHHRVRHRDLDPLQQRLDDPVAGLDLLLVLLAAAHLRADVRPELVEGVELARQTRELVVERGQHLLLDRLDRDGDIGRLALVLAQQLRREGDGRAGLLPADGVVQPVEHRPGADLVAQPGRLDALELLPVAGGGQVQGHEVVVAGRPVDAGQAGEPLAQPVDLGVDLGVGDLRVVHGDSHAVVVGDGDLGPDVDLGAERQLLVVCQLGDLDLGPAQGQQLVLADGLGVEGRQCLVDGVLEHRGAADALVQDPGGHLAATEARDLHPLADAAVGPVEARLELVEPDLHRQLHAGGVQRLDIALHAGGPSGVLTGGRTGSAPGVPGSA